jgi:hypothetical protein
MALIIGSVAMQFWFDNEVRKPKDLDFFGTKVPQFLVASYDKVDPFWHDSFAGTVLDRNDVASVNELYTIKCSHAYWELDNGSWGKHMADIKFLKQRGAQLDLELHQLLYPVWVEKHGKKKMNLAQAAGMFFKDAVVRKYDHDSIHDSVAFGDYPLYEDILKDGESVDIDPNKLWSMNHETLVKLFREEIAATALERWMIPTNYKFSPGRAYHMALKKTITSLTKGKSARFIVDNFADFSTAHDYMSIHRSKQDRLIPLETAK